MRNKLNRRALFIFILILAASFILPPALTRQAKAWFMVFSYISDLSVSATEISYNQERDGFVCINAYPYDPNHTDPGYPEYPYEFIDYDQPTSIYSGPFETAGLKNVSWQGRDQNGDIVEPGLYMFEAAIYSTSDCWPDSIISWYAEQAEFEVIGPPPPQSWSFAIISDLHVGQGENDKDYGGTGWNDKGSLGADSIYSVERLRQIANLINSNNEEYNIKFVVVTGDFTDSAELSEMEKAIEILNNLDVPWVPVLGNHDVWPYYGSNPDFTNRTEEMAPEVDDDMGTDRFFEEIFSSQYEKLSAIFGNWAKEDGPVWNSVTNPEHYSLFQNFAFDYGDYHFVILDFNSRDNEIYPLKGAAAEGVLHDFLGGTWQWFRNHLSEYIIEHPESNDDIILLAHHPFRKKYEKLVYNIGFSDRELGFIADRLTDYSDNIAMLFAGHTHETGIRDFRDIMPTIETAANVESPLARIVQFYPDGRIDYSKMLGNDMKITAHSPVDLEVIDPDGLVISKLTNEIPGANYFEEDFDGDGDSEDQIQIPDKKEGEYRIRVIAEPGAGPDETYSLDVATLEDNFGYTPIFLAQDVPVREIPVEPYSFQPQERAGTNIVYNGDISGQYSDAVNLIATLTDENGALLANKDIVFKIGEQSFSVTTDAAGIASASLTLNQIPGRYYSVEVNFSGDIDYLPSAAINDFEISKEDAVVNVLEKDGFVFDEIILEAEIKDNDGQNLLTVSDVEFKIGDRVIGTSTIDEVGVVKFNWRVDLIPKEIAENYLMKVIFFGNDYYHSAQGHANFNLKSAKWLKQDAITKLDAISTSDKKLKLQILAAKKLIQDSLSDNLWFDASRLIFFTDECLKKNNKDIEPDKIDAEKLFNNGKTDGLGKNCKWLNSGLRVFGGEFLAVKLLQKKSDIFDQVIAELVKADELLAKVAIFDAENSGAEGQQIEKAKERLAKAREEILINRPDKAIIDLTISWLHSQLAMKLARLKILKVA